MSFFNTSPKPITDMQVVDLVQDLYVKAISSHKSTPIKASDAEGQVQKFKLPAAPKSPEETNIASELKAYEDQVVEVEGASTTGEVPVEEDLFEEEEEEEEDEKGH